MTFDEFQDKVKISMEDICREFFRESKDKIKIKKEDVAVKNLVSICDATLKLGSEKGFHAMSLRDLCKESGLSMGAMYSYITSKDELLKVIHKHGQRAVKRILIECVEKGKDPIEKLHIAIETHVYLSELMRYWFYFFFMETKNLEKEDQKVPVESELWTEQMYMDILNEGIKQGCFEVKNLLLTGSSIKALLQDWYLKRWKYKSRKISVEDYVKYVTEFIESYVLKK